MSDHGHPSEKQRGGARGERVRGSARGRPGDPPETGKMKTRARSGQGVAKRGDSKDPVQQAMAAISAAFSKSPSEETLFAAVEANLTDDPTLDALIYKFAQNTLTLWRNKRQRA